MPKLIPVLALVLLSPAIAPQEQPLTVHARMLYAGLQNTLIRSAEKMPAEDYAFKPSPALRSYGEVIGDIADWQYDYCSVPLREANPAPAVDRAVASKVDLVTALKDALAYCDRAFSSMTDAAAAEPVDFRGVKIPRLGLLLVHLVHSTEHYASLVPYLRMKNILPPTSEPDARRFPGEESEQAVDLLRPKL